MRDSMGRNASAIAILAAIVALGGCEARKSSNPLSPTVAGPIPGVAISTPKVLDPQTGARIPVDKQPITLLVENASTNGVRPLYYTFEVASDPEFTKKVFSREKVAPGEGGRTSVRLPDALATGKTYFWRAQALDGANNGTPTNVSSFDVYTPIVIEAPAAISPAENSTVASLRPTFTVANAPRSGPVGAITYLIEISDAFGFATKAASWTAPEQSGQTMLQPAADLAANKVYFWRVRASDPTTTGPWSRALAFVTPDNVVIFPPSGPVGPDAFDLSAAVIHASPNAAAWPATTTITSLSFRSDGVAVEFSKKAGPGRWPDVTPPGWSGPLQYTLWIAMNIGGVWHTCGPIEYWYGLAASGGDVTVNNQIAANWTYYCGPMARQPAAGESVGFFVTAGDARLKDVAAVHERSNIVVVPFPSSAGKTYTF
jgi:hypothetical protein